MHNFLIGIILSLGSFLGIYHPQQFGVAVSQTIQGGTGTSSPSGILYGDNSATGHLNTVSIGSNLTFAAGTLSASGGTSAIATSSAETAGQLSYWTSTSATPATLGKVATGTISSSGGVTVTAGRAAVGGALAIGCTVADTSNTGCLSSTDWNTFNGKLSWPWTVATTYSTSTNSTTTPTWFKTALYASSTLATSSVIDALVSTYSTSTNATSTNEYVSGQFKNGSASGLALETSGVFSNVTTGTIGSTGVLGLSGGTPAYVATSSLFGTDTNGKVLALSSGAAAWVASTTFSAGTGIGLAQAGNTWTISNTGSTFAYPWGIQTNFGAARVASTTNGSPLWLQNGLYASTTLIADSATTTNSTSTTEYVSSQLRVASLSGLAILTSGVVSAYGGASACSSQFVTTISSTGGTSCASVTDSTFSGALGTAHGGTATTTWYNGGVTFYNSTLTTLSQSAASQNFFWDETNKRLGIGSSTPFAALSLDRNGSLASSTIVVKEYAYGSGTSTSMLNDCRTSTQSHMRMGSAAFTVTLTGLTPGQTCRVIIENPSGGTAGAVTWAAASGYQLYWPGGTVPAQTTTANKEEVWSFIVTAASSSIAILGAQTANF